jgi:hypothetical protein
MISACWLLTLIPAVWFGFSLCALLVANKSDREGIIDDLAKHVVWTKTKWSKPPVKPCDCGATIVHRDITGLWWQCAGCGKRLEEEA